MNALNMHDQNNERKETPNTTYYHWATCTRCPNFLHRDSPLITITASFLSTRTVASPSLSKNYALPKGTGTDADIGMNTSELRNSLTDSSLSGGLSFVKCLSSSERAATSLSAINDAVRYGSEREALFLKSLSHLSVVHSAIYLRVHGSRSDSEFSIDDCGAERKQAGYIFCSSPSTPLPS